MPDKNKKSNKKPPVYPKTSSPKKKKDIEFKRTTITAPTIIYPREEYSPIKNTMKGSIRRNSLKNTGRSYDPVRVSGAYQNLGVPTSKIENPPKRERSPIIYGGIKSHETKYPKPSTKKSQTKKLPTMFPTRNRKNTMLKFLESEPKEKATRKSYPVRVPRDDRDLVFLTNFTSDESMKPKSKKKKNKK